MNWPLLFSQGLLEHSNLSLGARPRRPTGCAEAVQGRIERDSRLHRLDPHEVPTPPQRLPQPLNARTERLASYILRAHHHGLEPQPNQMTRHEARGPWRGFEDVEFATLEWVSWYSAARALGYVPSAEYEVAFDGREKEVALS